MTTSDKSHDADVIVVGAGPSGTFLANLLGQAGLTCLLVERRREVPSASMAIGVMPPSLRRFSQIDLTAPILQSGCQVTRATALTGTSVLGILDFSGLPQPFNYILSIPQCELVRILRDRLSAWSGVRLLAGQETQSVTQTRDGVLVEIRDSSTGESTTLSARFAAGCDGSRSHLRTLLGIPTRGKAYAPSFAMGDFPESTPWANEARIFFSATGSVESFPLPQARRRWVIQKSSVVADATTIAERVRAVTGITIDAELGEWVTSFTPERRLCHRYFSGRVALCGDAAHVMSPIGGQGMNTGLADAWHLAAVLKRLCETGESPEMLFARYDRCRRMAFRIAANRAACGMWLGTRRGNLATSLRTVFVRDVLFGTPLRHRLPFFFSMLTIPDVDPVRQGRGDE